MFIEGKGSFFESALLTLTSEGNSPADSATKINSKIEQSAAVPADMLVLVQF